MKCECEIARTDIISCLEKIKFWSKKYKDSDFDNRLGIWEKTIKVCSILPEEILVHIKYLVDLDIEATKYVRLDFNQETMTIWQKMQKRPDWKGYWMNATGLDAEIYINALLGAIKYPQDRENRPIEKWFKDNNPNIKPVPYCIKIANDDFNKFLL